MAGISTVCPDKEIFAWQLGRSRSRSLSSPCPSLWDALWLQPQGHQSFPSPLLFPSVDVQVEMSTQQCAMSRELIKNPCIRSAETLKYLFMLPLPELKFIVSLERENGQVHGMKEVSASQRAVRSGMVTWSSSSFPQVSLLTSIRNGRVHDVNRCSEPVHHLLHFQCFAGMHLYCNTVT